MIDREKLFQAMETAESCRSGMKNVGEAEDIVVLSDFCKGHIPQIQDAKLSHDILTFTTVRKTLTTVADCLSVMERREADEFLNCLVSQINMLRSGNTSSKVWKQASSQVEEQYALERIDMQWKELIE